MKSIKIFLSTAALLLLVPLQASAYSAYTCDGQISRAMQDNETWYIDSCDNNYTRQMDAYYGAEAWNSMSGIHDRIWLVVYNMGCTGVNSNDGDWQIDFVAPSHSWLDGGLRGATRTRYAPCYWPYTGEVSDGEAWESDIVVDNTLTGGGNDPGELALYDDTYGVVTHEFGHALGMRHVGEFSIMAEADSRLPRIGWHNIWGSYHSSTHSQSTTAEDARFMKRFHSSSGAGKSDLYVSPWRVNSSGVMERNNSFYGPAGRGWWVNVNITLGNKGKQASGVVTGQVVMSTNTLISIYDHVMGSFTYQAGEGNGFNGTLQFLVPQTVPNGTYYVGFVIDSTNTEVEDNEYNNTSLAGITLVIAD